MQLSMEYLSPVCHINCISFFIKSSKILQIKSFIALANRINKATNINDLNEALDYADVNLKGYTGELALRKRKKEFNPENSVVKALQAFPKPVILLMGGHDKMTPVEEFMILVKEKAKELILMGEAAERFEDDARAAGIKDIHRAQSMKEAVRLGRDLAQPGDIVLLSPACSSFDWYSCFEERGEDFKKEVLALEEGSEP